MECLISHPWSAEYSAAKCMISGKLLTHKGELRQDMKTLWTYMQRNLMIINNILKGMLDLLAVSMDAYIMLML